MLPTFFMSIDLVLHCSDGSIFLESIKVENSYLRGSTIILYHAG